MQPASGARVTGLEPSNGFYRYALHREQTEQLGIQYVQADLSIWTPPASTFQTVIANMVLNVLHVGYTLIEV